MVRKKRIALLFCFLALGWMAWSLGAFYALLCFLGALFLLGLFNVVGIGWDSIGRRQLPRHEYTFATQEHYLTNTSVVHPWRFAVVGDTRNNTAITRQLYQKISEMKPLVVFHTGDIVRSGTAREFRRNHLDLLAETLHPIPMFCIAGNHERGPLRDFRSFKAIYGSDEFSFTLGECLFVGVNNSGKERLSDALLAHLDEKLTGNSCYKFVFIHIPPAFFEASFVNDSRRRGFKKNAEEFHQLMVRHKVTEVFTSHIHGFATMTRDGVRYTLTAGGGAPLSKRITQENRKYHFISIEISPEWLRRTVVLWDGSTWSYREIST